MRRFAGPALLLLATLGLAMPALAEPKLRPADRDRLMQLDAHLGAALRVALAKGAATDIALVERTMRGVAQPGADPAGNWNCRVIKLGGLSDLVAYPNFSCRITAGDDGQWRIEKLTGSQLFRGTLTRTDEGLLYRGVGFVGDSPARLYDKMPPEDQTPLEPNQTTAEVGYFEQTGPNSARLLLPDPILESRFDLFYFTR